MWGERSQEKLTDWQYLPGPRERKARTTTGYHEPRPGAQGSETLGDGIELGTEPPWKKDATRPHMGSPVRENLLNNIAVIYFCATRGGSLETQLVRVGEGRDVADRDEGGLALEQGRGSLSHTRTDTTIRNLTAVGGDEAVT